MNESVLAMIHVATAEISLNRMSKASSGQIPHLAPKTSRKQTVGFDPSQTFRLFTRKD
jgi:hypothetical protein